MASAGVSQKDPFSGFGIEISKLEQTKDTMFTMDQDLTGKTVSLSVRRFKESEVDFCIQCRFRCSDYGV